MKILKSKTKYFLSIRKKKTISEHSSTTSRTSVTVNLLTTLALKSVHEEQKWRENNKREEQKKHSKLFTF